LYKLNNKLSKDLTKVEDNIGDIKVELHNMAVAKEKRKIGEIFHGDGGFLQVMSTIMKKK
jgi:hypothetical protein